MALEGGDKPRPYAIPEGGTPETIVIMTFVTFLSETISEAVSKPI